MNTPIFS